MRDASHGTSTQVPSGIRTWWMKRHDAVNVTILGVLALFILWATFFR
jgi:hypothetical protein